jgi:hypothetical protein
MLDWRSLMIVRRLDIGIGGPFWRSRPRPHQRRTHKKGQQQPQTALFLRRSLWPMRTRSMTGMMIYPRLMTHHFYSPSHAPCAQSCAMLSVRHGCRIVIGAQKGCAAAVSAL